MKKWHCRIDGNEIGPLTSKELRQLANAGNITHVDWIRKDGSQTWHKAEKLKGLFASNPVQAEPQSEDQEESPADGKPLNRFCPNCNKKLFVKQKSCSSLPKFRWPIGNCENCHKTFGFVGLLVCPKCGHDHAGTTTALDGNDAGRQRRAKTVLENNPENLPTRKLIKTELPIHQFAMFPDGEHVVGFLRGGRLAIWNLSTREVIEVAEVETGQPSAFGISNDGRFVLIGVGNSEGFAGIQFKWTFFLWDRKSGEPRVVDIHKKGVLGVAFNSMSEICIAHPGAVRICNLESQTKSRTISIPTGAIAFSRIDDVVATSSTANEVEIWSLKTGERLERFEIFDSKQDYLKNEPTNALAFSAD